MNAIQSKQVADTTFRHLGGGKFVAMTGAKYVTCDENGTLGFALGRNPGGYSHVKISVNSHDFYDAEFFQIRKHKTTKTSRVNDIFVEDLRKAFGEVTGLLTNLT